MTGDLLLLLPLGLKILILSSSSPKLRGGCWMLLFSSGLEKCFGSDGASLHLSFLTPIVLMHEAVRQVGAWVVRW